MAEGIPIKRTRKRVLTPGKLRVLKRARRKPTPHHEPPPSLPSIHLVKDRATGDAIKAIETIYNGYRFRSRLEARWAVFLDTLDVPYEYEKEGFETPHGRYLPDFWLSKQSTWMEVKPSNISEDEVDIANLKLRSLLRMGQTSLLVIGAPRDYTTHERILLESQERWIHCNNSLTIGALDNALFILPDDRGYFSQRIQAAIDAAMHARFEHGETPMGPRDA